MGAEPITVRHLASLLAAALLAGCTSPGGLSMASVRASMSLDRETTATPASTRPVEVANRPTDPPAAGHELPPAALQPGGGGQGADASAPVGEVRDEAELPLEGVEVTLPNGSSARTDADGRFSTQGAWSPGPVVLSKPGFATSVVHGLDGPSSFHLRRNDNRTDAYVQRREPVDGIVNWPDDVDVDVRGAVHYMDSLGSHTRPSLIHRDGRFALEVETIRPGEPKAVLLVFGVTGANNLLMGVSTPFHPFRDEPAPVTMHPANHDLAYAFSDRPSGLTSLETRLEVLHEGAPALVVDSSDSAAGTFRTVAPGTLPGTMRVTVEARDPATGRASIVSQVPALGTVTGAFLAPPSVHLAGSTVSWSEVPEATGYRVSVQTAQAQVLVFEAWCSDETPLVLPTAAIGPGNVVRVEAVADAGIMSRHVAAVGPRQLRVAPWEGRPAYRMARAEARM
jgi:hypothetical protein